MPSALLGDSTNLERLVCLNPDPDLAVKAVVLNKDTKEVTIKVNPLFSIQLGAVSFVT